MLRRDQETQSRSKSPLPVDRIARKPTVDTVRWVVLDIDSTLVFARPADLEKPVVTDERNFYVRPTSMETVLRVTKRPHLEKFLDDLEKERYKVVVWSAGAPSYVKAVVSYLFEGRRFEYVMTCDHLVGDTKKLGRVRDFVRDFVPENARLVDDSKYHSEGQEHLFVHVDRYEIAGHDPTAEEDDDVLRDMVEVIGKSFEK